MLIRGVWHACDDGVLRPVMLAEVQSQDGSWIKALFLVDSGADRTVLSADILTALRFPQALAGDRLAGIGGEVNTVLVETRIRLSHDHDGKVNLLHLWHNLLFINKLRATWSSNWITRCAEMNGALGIPWRACQTDKTSP